MIIIEKELTIEDGKKREQFWIDYYRNNGYNILNKQKGGGIGHRYRICIRRWENVLFENVY